MEQRLEVGCSVNLDGLCHSSLRRRMARFETACDFGCSEKLGERLRAIIRLDSERPVQAMPVCFGGTIAWKASLFRQR